MNTETKNILDIFKKISSIPRCSGNQKEIREWLINFSKKNNLRFSIDNIGNIIIYIPATKNYKNHQTITLQGHMDMVCEKTPDSSHNFKKDPIEFIYDGDWLTANKTTLGADNGIAIAIALNIALDKEIEHPSLELLFTVDEETGLTGALNLENEKLKGKYLINIDSESEGVFTIGCAGGRDTKISLPLVYEKNDNPNFKLSIGGLKGGHSGMDIDKNRGNAIVFLTRTLKCLFQMDDNLRLIDIEGGTAHNAIPREAHSFFSSNLPFLKLKEKIEIFEKDFINENNEEYSNLKLYISQVECNKNPLDKTTTEDTINLLYSLPHGPLTFNSDNSVETSNNLAKVSFENDCMKILTSQRSSITSKLDFLTSKIECISTLAGAKFKSNKGYPSWQPNWNSYLLKVSKKKYKELFDSNPEVISIHAGLECGIIGGKHPQMEMISVGPNIENPHSPNEKLFIPDIIKIRKFVISLLKALK